MLSWSRNEILPSYSMSEQIFQTLSRLKQDTVLDGLMGSLAPELLFAIPGSRLYFHYFMPLIAFHFVLGSKLFLPFVPGSGAGTVFSFVRSSEKLFFVPGSEPMLVGPTSQNLKCPLTEAGHEL